MGCVLGDREAFSLASLVRVRPNRLTVISVAAEAGPAVAASSQHRRRATAALVASLLVLLGSALIAAERNPTAAFLGIPLTARAVGLGRGVAAVTEGVGALSENPAGFALLRHQEVSLLYAPHLQGNSLSHVAYGGPTRLGSMGVSHLSLRSNALDGRDEEGRPTGGFSAEDRAVGVSWAAPLGPRLPLLGRASIGANAKHVTSRVGSFQASTYAFDVGAQAVRRVGALPMRFGLAVRNIGPGLALQDRRDPLPLQVSAAVSAQPLGMLTLSAGGSRCLVNKRDEFSLGAEAAPLSGVFFRGNYGALRGGGAASQVLPQLSWGVGMRLASWQFDYAFMPLGELGSSQRLSLTTRFGAPAGASRLSVADWSRGEQGARSLARLAWEAVKEGRLAAAAVHFERALDAEPGNRMLPGVLGRAQAAAGELAVIEGSASWAVLARRGAAAFIDGRDLDEAVLFLRRAYEQAQGDARLLALLNRVEGAANVSEPTGKPILARSAGFVEDRLRGARNAIYDGQYEVGARRAGEALEVDPGNVRGLMMLGSAQYLLGSRQKAREAWEQALALEPGNAELAEFLGRTR